MPEALLEDIGEIEAGDKVSVYQGKVCDLIKIIEKYREPFKNKPKEQPFDYGAAGNAIKELKNAEKAFDVEKQDVYITKKAIDAAGKVYDWIRSGGAAAENDGGKLDPDKVQKALDFHEKVLAAVERERKKKKKVSSKVANNVAAVKEYSDELLDKTIAALKDTGEVVTSEKFKNGLIKFKSDAGDFKTYFKAAMSGVWSNFKNAAKNPRCTKVNVSSTNSREYKIEKAEETTKEDTSES